MDHETTRQELYDQIECLKAANARLAREVEGYKEMASSQFNTAEKLRAENARRVQDRHELVDPTIDLLRRISGHLEPYVCFESLRKDVIDDINRLQGSLPP